jgi:hypothetical protein
MQRAVRFVSAALPGAELRAFSSEMGTGSREENAIKQGARAAKRQELTLEDCPKTDVAKGLS